MTTTPHPEIDECITVRTQGFDLAARVTRPREAPVAVIVLWSAMGVKASHYDAFGAELAASGFGVVTVDLRGQGDSLPVPRRGHAYGYEDVATQDWPRVIAAARETFGPDLPLYVLGHSLGGQMSLLHLARHPESVDGMVLVASGSVHYRCYSGLARLKVLLGPMLIALISAVLGYWPGDRLGFGGRQSARLVRDWARTARTGRWRPAGAGVDYESLLPGVRIPVLAISVEGDDLAPPSAVDGLCRKLPSARVERWHTALPARGGSPHFRWVRDAEGIALRIREWFDAGRPGAAVEEGRAELAGGDAGTPPDEGRAGTADGDGRVAG
ncbi:alpha/beta fold hydrolase [Streptomyces sp. NPDC047108]|uniref:alpha/beta hydrolase family protein n=1 Tax=Streptomyces sp. NPDC047108 TaxID=3155025 RepID=UPI0033E93EFC